MGLNHEKNRGRKSRDTLPLAFFGVVYELFLTLRRVVIRLVVLRYQHKPNTNSQIRKVCYQNVAGFT